MLHHQLSLVSQWLQISVQWCVLLWSCLVSSLRWRPVKSLLPHVISWLANFEPWLVVRAHSSVRLSHTACKVGWVFRWSHVIINLVVHSDFVPSSYSCTVWLSLHNWITIRHFLNHCQIRNSSHTWRLCRWLRWKEWLKELLRSIFMASLPLHWESISFLLLLSWSLLEALIDVYIVLRESICLRKHFGSI